jgi:hypothetical protein
MEVECPSGVTGVNLILHTYTVVHYPIIMRELVNWAKNVSLRVHGIWSLIYKKD